MKEPMDRIGEIDFLKGVLIILMVVFHLAYIGDSYPSAKAVVYSFHMPAFLVISGYLANTNKPPRAFVSSILWLLVPYAVMESGYIVAASCFPIMEHIVGLTPLLFLRTLAMHPLGPYWYLHTLVLCNVVCYMIKGMGLRNRIILCALLFWLLSLADLLSLSNAIYYLCGAAIRQSGAPFVRVFRPSWLCFVPVAVLCATDGLASSRAEGFAMTYFVMSGLLCFSGLRIVTPLKFIGRNTLPVVLFSPVFTLLSKSFQPVLLALDPSALLFAASATAFTICGSLGIALAMDCVGATRYFIGKRRFILFFNVNKP